MYPDEFPSSINFLMVIPAINRYGYLQYQWIIPNSYDIPMKSHYLMG